MRASALQSNGIAVYVHTGHDRKALVCGVPPQTLAVQIEDESVFFYLASMVDDGKGKRNMRACVRAYSRH
jgi:hypothetical protein